MNTHQERLELWVELVEQDAKKFSASIKGMTDTQAEKMLADFKKIVPTSAEHVPSALAEFKKARKKDIALHMGVKTGIDALAITGLSFIAPALGAGYIAATVATAVLKFHSYKQANTPDHLEAKMAYTRHLLSEKVRTAVEQVEVGVEEKIPYASSPPVRPRVIK